MVKTDDYFDMEKPHEKFAEEVGKFLALLLLTEVIEDLEMLSGKSCRVCGIVIENGIYCSDYCWKRDPERF